jgi:hypothetical protein
MLVKAIEAAQEQLDPEHVSAETPDHRSAFAARRADAVALVAQSFLKGGSSTGAEIVVHVDERTLRDGASGRCGLEEGPSLPAETARRLSCDASFITLIENGKQQPVSVGRKTRTIPPSIKRALRARDGGCRFPGCPNKRYVDGHPTKLSNLVMLCHFHHRRVHEGNVKIKVLDDGAVRFIQPNGKSLDAPAPSPSDWTSIVARNVELGIVIDQHTAESRWTGERMDYSTAIKWLLGRRRRVSAETLR